MGRGGKVYQISLKIGKATRKIVVESARAREKIISGISKKSKGLIKRKDFKLRTIKVTKVKGRFESISGGVKKLFKRKK